MADDAVFKLGSFGNFYDLRFTNEESRKTGRQCPGFKIKRSHFATLAFIAYPIKKEVWFTLILANSLGFRGLIYLELWQVSEARSQNWGDRRFARLPPLSTLNSQPSTASWSFFHHPRLYQGLRKRKRDHPVLCDIFQRGWVDTNFTDWHELRSHRKQESEFRSQELELKTGKDGRKNERFQVPSAKFQV